MKNPYGLHFKVQLAQMNSRVRNIASYLDRACLTSTDLGIYEGSGDNEVEILSEGAFLHCTAGGFVWCDRPFYLVKQPQENFSNFT